MLLVLSLLAGCAALRPETPAVSPVPDTYASDRALGAELFSRTWVLDDPRSGSGDGLGPISNARSCTACHNQGGPGGAGPAARNVPVPGGGASVVRNPPTLFGLGRVDDLPSKALIDAANRGRVGPLPPYGTGAPETPGRLALDAQGRIGRFGWKASVAGLADFVSQACAIELGLQVAGHDQRPVLGKAVGPGDDMTARELGALVLFVQLLPAPRAQTETPRREEGAALFHDLACDGCHVADLGSVRGGYTDLLLHDMGPALSQSNGFGYYGRTVDRDLPPGAAKNAEWRTPPLWGLRDTAPYLHDGRARTVLDAIRAHDGAAKTERDAFVALPLQQQEVLLSFLDTL